MSEILRQLSWASRRSGVRIESITPSQPVASTGAQAVPITLAVKGRYFRLAKFMHLLRLEAGVKNGKAYVVGAALRHRQHLSSRPATRAAA